MSLIKSLIKTSYLKLVFSLFKLFPVKQGRVLFSSFYGRQCSGDPKAIYEKLLSLDTHHELIWVMNKPSNVRARTVKRYSLSHLYYLATCEFRIDNCQESRHLTPKPATTYLQTWHGTPLKKIAQDLDDAFNAHKQDWLLDAQYWNYLLAPSSEIADIFSTAFKIERQKVLTTGNPRNELLTKKPLATVDKIKADLNIPQGKKVILYAPTFRDDEQGKFHLQLTHAKITERLGNNYVFLVRLHSNIKQLVNGKFDGQSMVDVTTYDDIQELMLISDLLITDYSSVFFDFAILQRPMIFYPYDIEKYKNKLRGFYFDYQTTVPGEVVYDEDTLLNTIIRLEQEEYKVKQINHIHNFNLKFNESEVDITRILNRIGLINET